MVPFFTHISDLLYGGHLIVPEFIEFVDYCIVRGEVSQTGRYLYGCCGECTSSCHLCVYVWPCAWVVSVVFVHVCVLCVYAWPCAWVVSVVFVHVCVYMSGKCGVCACVCVYMSGKCGVCACVCVVCVWVVCDRVRVMSSVWPCVCEWVVHGILGVESTPIKAHWMRQFPTTFIRTEQTPSCETTTLIYRNKRTLH